MTCTPSISRLFALCAVFALMHIAAFAASVRGMISSPSVSVGEETMYELVIEGGDVDVAPNFPSVDGLLVESRGRDSRMVLSFGGSSKSSSSTITYRYAITPQRAGDFVIPPIEVKVEGQILRTTERGVKATPGQKLDAAGDFAFAEIRLERAHAYVGEDVSVTVSYYLDLTARWGLAGSQMPSITGDGYTARPMMQSAETEAVLAGKRYVKMTLKGVVTPNRAGKISLGPCSMRFMYSKPLPNPDRWGSIFDRPQVLTVTAPAREIEVRPLPTQGRPKDFSGAVGKFRIDSAGKPDRIKAGEPITMTIAISGQGNFDRISVPPIENSDGWRTYPPTDEFRKDDPLGLTGTKVFQIATLAEKPQDSMPIFLFSYFDADAEKYVTLKTNASPLVIEGTFAAPAPATTAPAAPLVQSAKPDILGLLPNAGIWGTVGTVSLKKWLFLMGAPLGLVAFIWAWRGKVQDPRTTERASLRKEKITLLARAKATQNRTELLDAAARLLRIHVALAADVPLSDVDENDVLARSDTAGIREIFDARADLVYAGSSSGDVGGAERDRVLITVMDFERGVK